MVRIAASTVGRWLAAEKIRPWRYHTWQHMWDPQAFLERARPVRVTQALQATLLAKVKSFNPLGSLKDRIGVNRIEATTAALDATAEQDESDGVQSRAWEVPQMLRGQG